MRFRLGTRCAGKDCLDGSSRNIVGQGTAIHRGQPSTIDGSILQCSRAIVRRPRGETCIFLRISHESATACLISTLEIYKSDIALYIRRGNRRRGSPSGTYSDWRCKTQLGVRAEMRSCLLQTMQGRRRGRALNDLDRVVVLSSTISTAFITLLLQHFLCFGVRKTEKQLHSVLSDNVVEIRQYFFCDIA